MFNVELNCFSAKNGGIRKSTQAWTQIVISIWPINIDHGRIAVPGAIVYGEHNDRSAFG